MPPSGAYGYPIGHPLEKIILYNISKGLPTPPAMGANNEGNLTPDLLDPNQIRQLLRHILLTMPTPDTYLGRVGLGQIMHAD